MSAFVKNKVNNPQDAEDILQNVFIKVETGVGDLNQLPEEFREIIIDVEMKGVKQKDLTEKYGPAYTSIRSRVHRGREKLKQPLLQCCNIQWDNRGTILDALRYIRLYK